MANLNDLDFINRVQSRINQHAKSMVNWHAGSNRGGSYMKTAPLVPLSNFNYQSAATLSGDARADTVRNIIAAEAKRCTAVRRSVTGRYYSGSDYSSGYRSVQYGYAALNTSYQQNLYSPNLAVNAPYLVTKKRDADLSNLENYIERVRTELNDKIVNGGTIDLRVCHTSCHNNCHGSRSRR